MSRMEEPSAGLVFFAAILMLVGAAGPLVRAVRFGNLLDWGLMVFLAGISLGMAILALWLRWIRR